VISFAGKDETMNQVANRKNKCLKIIICLMLVCGIFGSTAQPVAAASNVFSKKVVKDKGTWSGSARHASTFITISYKCKRGLTGYKNYCEDRVGLNGKHRARIKCNGKMETGKKTERGISSVAKMDYIGKTIYFQSEYHMN
jgi:hypothetical protein